MTDYTETDTYSDDIDPDGFTDEGFTDLHINFSDEEAASEAIAAVPSGKYDVVINKVELKASKSEKNPGKPFYAISMKITDGPYAKRNIFTNVMLWSGAAYSLAQLMKACGFPVNQGKIRVPRPEEFLGQELSVRGVKVPAQGQYDEKYEVKGFMKLGGGVAVGGGPTSLEP